MQCESQYTVFYGDNIMADAMIVELRDFAVNGGRRYIIHSALTNFFIASSNSIPSAIAFLRAAFTS